MVALLDESKHEVVFKPIPDSSQEIALDSRCHHTLYHGTRGPGKTATQLMRFRLRVGLGYGAFWRGVIFDCEFKNLADLVAQSKKFFGKFNDGAKFHESASSYKWVWPTGEELHFRHAKKLSDYEAYHGHEYPFIGWNELTKHPTGELYDKMCSTNRSSFEPKLHTPMAVNKNGEMVYDTFDGQPLPPIPLEVFSTCNPSGIGHNWVKHRFIDCAEPGEVVRRTTKVFDPKTKEEVDAVKTQIAIFGTYRENTFLSVDYIAELDRLTEGDENLRKAWLFGNWDVVSGGAINDLWDSKAHIVPRFKVPKGWRVDRSFDWGSSHPFSVCWWAEANGEEVKLPDGSTFCPVAGSIIQLAEWYGAKDQGGTKYGHNKGLLMSAPDVAKGILEVEENLLSNGWIESKPQAGPADNQISDVRESDTDSIAKKMLKLGVKWIASDKKPGSRINGLQLLRDMLLASVKKEGPGIYFMRNCEASIKTLPPLKRDDKNIDDVDTTCEDHVYDAARYRILNAAPRMAKNVKIRFGG